MIPHDHFGWINEGKACHICSDYFEQNKILRARLKELEDRLRLNGIVCEICWTSSFAPCELGKKGSIPDPRNPSIGMFCQYCWLKGEYK